MGCGGGGGAGALCLEWPAIVPPRRDCYSGFPYPTAFTATVEVAAFVRCSDLIYQMHPLLNFSLEDRIIKKNRYSESFL